MRRQPRIRIQTIPANPIAQTPKIATVAHDRVLLTGGDCGNRSENGWLTCTIANDTEEAGIEETLFVTGAQSTRLPRTNSRENGTRNLIDALNHSQ